MQVARELDRRGLATLRLPDALTRDDIVEAAQRSVRVTTPPPFSLLPTGRARVSG